MLRSELRSFCQSSLNTPHIEWFNCMLHLASSRISLEARLSLFIIFSHWPSLTNTVSTSPTTRQYSAAASNAVFTIERSSDCESAGRKSSTNLAAISSLPTNEYICASSNEHTALPKALLASLTFFLNVCSRFHAPRTSSLIYVAEIS